MARWPTAVGEGRTLRLTGAGLALIAVCYGLARFAYGLFVPAFRDAFGLDAATAGSIASASYAAYCVAIVAATVLTPRLGSRSVALLAGGLATAGTALIGIAPNASVLAVGVVVAGSSTGVASPPLAHAVAATIAARRRDRVQAVVNAGTGLGVMVSGPVALLAQDQWRAAWLVFAALSALVTLWVAVAVPAVRDGATGEERPAGLLPRPLLADGAVRLLTTAAVVGVASSAVWTFGRDLLTTSGQLSHQASTVAWIVLGACGLLGALAGDLAARVGLGRAWTAAVLTVATATALLALVPGNVAVAGGATALFGASYIAVTGLVLIAGTRTYRAAPAAGVGLAFLALALGQAAGAPLVGLLIDTTSPRTAFAVAALVAVASSTLRPTTPRATPGRGSQRLRATAAETAPAGPSTTPASRSSSPSGSAGPGRPGP